MVNTKGFDPETGAWNDSLSGDFIWGNTNIGEALSSVVTPYTWSVIGGAYDQVSILPGHHAAGNIGGRPYQNGTVMVSALKAVGKDIEDMFKELGGQEEVPEGLTIPVIEVSWRDRLSILYGGIRMQLRERSALRNLPRFVADNPGWCTDIVQRVRAAVSGDVLAGLWHEIEDAGIEAFWTVVGTVWRYGEVVAPLRRELEDLAGQADASALLSSVSRGDELLASLGPVVGLSKVARGEMTRQAYLEQYGHRGPDEAEFAAPRPAEDPDWLDRQLDLATGVDAEELLARQRAEYEAAWGRFQDHYPDQTEKMQKRLALAAGISRQREAVRSELTRQIWAGRAWALRAGEITGLGDDTFYLIDAEILNLLTGKPAPVETLPTRKRTYDRYRALPPYPPIISGQFEPFAWAADPNRRADIYDSHATQLPLASAAGPAGAITGVPSSAGVAEGRVRRIDSPEEGAQLQPGEVLVSSQTNVGWTLLFPTAAAVVTDVGAPLSHAAIVARELGIPAVVGCGDATTRLQTGDQVRVDGTTGRVEILLAQRHEP